MATSHTSGAALPASAQAQAQAQTQAQPHSRRTGGAPAVGSSSSSSAPSLPSVVAEEKKMRSDTSPAVPAYVCL